MVEDWNWYDDWCGVIGLGVGVLISIVAGWLPVPEGYEGSVTWQIQGAIPMVGFGLGVLLIVAFTGYLCWTMIKSAS